MRRLLLPVLMSGALCTPALAASPITGVWGLSKGHARIRIDECGQALCGQLVDADKLRKRPNLKDKMNKDPALRERPVRGLLILSGFTGGPVKWTGGRVYNPDDGRIYKSELRLAGEDTLQVKGCVVKPLCKSQTLTRVR